MIGGDLRVAEYRFRARSQKLDFVLFPTDANADRISMFSAVMMLCKIGIATDPFLISNSFNCGIIQTLLFCIALLLLTQISIHLYFRCWFYGTAYNYADIWSCVFGPTFKFIPIILNIFVYLSFVVWHGFEICYDLQLFLLEYWPGVPSFLINKWLLTYAICIITALPVLFFKKFDRLAWIAYIGNISILGSLGCIVAHLIRTVSSDGFDPNKQIVYFSSDVRLSFSCISDFNEAFFFQSMLDVVLKDMYYPTIGRCLSSTWISTGISAVIHYLIGLCGYLHFIEPEEDNIFYNLSPKSPEVIAGKVFSYIVTITSNQIYTYFLSTQVSSLIVSRMNDDVAPVFISGIVVVLFYVGMNFVGDKATYVFEFISSASFTILVFLLPAMFYLKLYKFTRPIWSIVALILIIIGIPLAVSTMYFEITAPQ